MSDHDHYGEGIARDYGVEEYVPMEARHYGFWDMASTWVGANCQPGAWFIGGSIAAAGFMTAFGVTMIANPLAYLILALVGFMGFKVATTTMGLTRFSFGIIGSKLPSALNSISLIGWTSVGSFIGGISMSYVFSIIFGWPAYGEPGGWKGLAFGAGLNAILTCFLVAYGGSKLIRKAENVSVVLMVVISIWMTYAVLKTFPISEILAWKPDPNFKMPLGISIDTMAAFSISWVPCVAEYTRYCKTKTSATVAPLLGATVALYWFALVGVMAVIASAIQTGTFDPNACDPSSVATSLGLGIPMLIVIILSTITTDMVALFSGCMSTLNVFPNLNYEKTLWTTGIVTVLIAFIPIVFGSFMDFFYVFVGYLGAVFPPLIAVMATDYYFVRKGDYKMEFISDRKGIYWYTNGINWVAMGSWIAGMAIYFLLQKLVFIHMTIGIVFPATLITAIIYGIAGKMSLKNGMGFFIGEKTPG
ncbi:purine-cytosine permease family protein [Candidatus Formimonas warabiya]|uniref:Cytosine permease n=1 Tax=Formimonas warabiya TaxID=1761012 RepID=A0A3G1KRU7_FORW1|nr:cytosine permease [Candidatus Formimonas warabiya]ATW24855.1 hypothetical protein DCMF_08775 [Candidatus Formimonas warabiya]